MLRELTVDSFAIIDRLGLCFEPGFNVLTGETGAGKSILIDAMEVALGGRASADYIRSGADRAVVEAVFTVASSSPARRCLDELGVELGPDGLLTLTREVARGGRNTGRANGRPASVGMLREITQHLVDIHGQHEHQSLLRPERHVDFLDSYGGERVLELRHRVERGHARRRELEAARAALAGDGDQRQRQRDLLRFQAEEIEQARIRIGEEAELLAERTVLGSVERLRELVTEAYSDLSEQLEGQSLVERWGRLTARVSEAARIDAALNPSRELLETLGYQVQDLTRDLRRYLEGLQYDPRRLEEVERRLDLLNGLKRKYGPALEDVLAFRERALADLERIQAGEATARQLEVELDETRQALGELAGQLSVLRGRAAGELERRVEAELGDLGMDEVCFRVNLEQEEDPDGVPVGDALLSCTSRGVDRAEFLFSPNPGEPPRPLARIASGGELSRVMLALQALVAEVDEVPTVIFDEVDAGVGGSAAAAVGQKLCVVGARRQVLLVTHLAPIGCLADAHFRIAKDVRRGRTVTSVERLGEADRVQEIARMMAGAQVSAITLSHAEEMLAAGNRWKDQGRPALKPGVPAP